MCQKCKGLFGCNIHMCRQSSLQQPGTPGESLARSGGRGEKPAGRTPAKPVFAGLSAINPAAKR